RIERASYTVEACPCACRGKLRQVQPCFSQRGADSPARMSNRKNAMKIESRFILAAALAGAAFVMTGGMQAAAQAVAAEEGKAAAPKETSIPFANMGGIRDWR